jgi:hypothetical protein
MNQGAHLALHLAGHESLLPVSALSKLLRSALSKPLPQIKRDIDGD